MPVPIWGPWSGKRGNADFTIAHSIVSGLTLLLLLFSPGINLGQHRVRAVFYNTENLFDTRKAEKNADEEFLPGAVRHWTYHRYERKIQLIYKALMAAGSDDFPDLIGLAEIEDYGVLEQLIRSTPLSRIPYGIVHKESPDPRGIDVALLYRKDRIWPVDLNFLPVSAAGKGGFRSRDILCFTAKIGSENLYLFINHWPSRSGGYLESRGKRLLAAQILRLSIDTLLNRDANAKILILGDFNATPYEHCITETLGAHPYPGNGSGHELINLSTRWSKQETGTIKTGSNWEIFDQIICSATLLKGKGMLIDPQQTTICRAPFLVEPDPVHLGVKPNRTYRGPAYHGGISDHLPVVVTLIIPIAKLSIP